MAGTQLIADYLTKSITVRASWDRFRAFTNLLKVENLGGVAADDGEGSQDAVESMVRVAKLAARLAGCAAMTWPSYSAKAAVAAALAIGLAYEVSRG